MRSYSNGMALIGGRRREAHIALISKTKLLKVASPLVLAVIPIAKVAPSAEAVQLPAAV